MAGYTDAAFRELCHRYGARLCYTEVVNAEGLVHHSKPTFHLLETVPEEAPVAAHIYGCKPEVMAEAAAMIEKLNRFVLIDINAGCPVRKIVAKGSGAALMKDPRKLHDIVRAVVDATCLPVTVKTRIGLTPDRINIDETSQAVEEAGAKALAIHARVASMHHKGAPDWQCLADTVEARTIPIIGNGGINTPEDALKMVEETGVAGVMLARGAVGNPWIFRDILHLLAGRSMQRRSLEDCRRVIVEHLDALIRLKEIERACRRRSLPPEESAALHFRAHLHQYLAGFHGWGTVRRRLNDIHTREAVLEAVDWVLARQGPEGEGPG
jgi:tRNA-dihydrouridine synthase B